MGLLFASAQLPYKHIPLFTCMNWMPLLHTNKKHTHIIPSFSRCIILSFSLCLVVKLIQSHVLLLWRTVSFLLDQGFKSQECCFFHPLSNDATICKWRSFFSMFLYLFWFLTLAGDKVPWIFLSLPCKATDFHLCVIREQGFTFVFLCSIFTSDSELDFIEIMFFPKDRLIVSLNLFLSIYSMFTMPCSQYFSKMLENLEDILWRLISKILLAVNP